MKCYPVRFVDRAHHVADRRAHDPFHGASFGRNNVYLQPPDPQRSRDFQADETRTDHYTVPNRGDTSNQRIAVSERAKDVNVRQHRSWDLQSDGLGTGGKQERAIGWPLAIRHDQCVRVWFNCCDVHTKPQIDGIPRIKLQWPQRDPICLRGPRQIIFRQVRSVARR